MQMTYRNFSFFILGIYTEFGFQHIGLFSYVSSKGATPRIFYLYMRYLYSVHIYLYVYMLK